MDWSTLVAGVVGAVVGALVTAASGWWISGRLAAQAEFRQLRAAMWIVQLELDENRTRVDGVAPNVPDRPARLKQSLLLGDWKTTKLDLAPLAHYDDVLFQDVARLYGIISDFKSGRRQDEPDSEEMTALAAQLREARTHLRQQPYRMTVTYKSPRRIGPKQGGTR